MIAKPLPLCVAHMPGESATSFASRLARRNGVRRLVTFCSDVGLDYSQLMNGAPAEIERLAAWAGQITAHCNSGRRASWGRDGSSWATRA